MLGKSRALWLHTDLRTGSVSPDKPEDMVRLTAIRENEGGAASGYRSGETLKMEKESDAMKSEAY